MRPEWFPDWSGQTCVIVASGPSAGAVDLSIARGHARFIVINESWRLAPWADVLYGCDDSFWKAKQGVKEFAGLRVSQDKIACLRNIDNPHSKIQRVICDKAYDTLILDRPGTIGWGGNSGFHAINLAVQFGAKKIILVGYDMRLDRGLHWHGKHPPSMNNPIDTNVVRWCRAVDGTAVTLAKLGIETINCSAVSRLENFPRMTFKDAIARVNGCDIVREREQRLVRAKKIRRVLVVGNNYQSADDISSYGDQYAYFLQQEFGKRGIEIIKVKRGHEAATNLMDQPLEEFDALLGFGIRMFEKDFTRETLEPIRKRMRGPIAQFAEFPPEQSMVDVTLCSKLHFRLKNHQYPKWHVIGWAADHEICKPSQETGGPLRILLDHGDYNPTRTDYTDLFVRQIESLTKNDGLWRRYGYTGVEVESLTSPKKNGAPKIPFPEIAKKYAGAHVFIMTHGESVGMSVIEAATSGCLVVVPKGFMDEVLIDTVRRIETQEARIPWDLVLRKIDPHGSRERAMRQSWSKVCDRVIEGLEA